MLFSDLLEFLDWDAYAHPATWLMASAVFAWLISYAVYHRADCGDLPLGFNWYFHVALVVAAGLWFAVWAVEIRVVYKAWAHGAEVFAFRRGIRSLFDLLSGYVVPPIFLLWAIAKLWSAYRLIKRDKIDPFKV